MNNEKPIVLIGIPTNGYAMDNCITAALNAMNQYGNAGFTLRQDKPIDHNRNMMVHQRFLPSEATHLLFVDSDTMIPPHTIGKLLELDVEVACGIYSVMKMIDGLPHYSYCCGDLLLDNEKYLLRLLGEVPTKPFKVTFSGCGCMLIKRNVFEKMPKPWFLHKYIDVDKLQRTHEDTHFCQQLQQLDIPIWMHPDVMCEHIKPAGLQTLRVQAQLILDKSLKPDETVHHHPEGYKTKVNGTSQQGVQKLGDT